MADENELGLSTPVSDGMLLAALRLLVKRPQWRLRLSTLDAGVGTQPEKNAARAMAIIAALQGASC